MSACYTLPQALSLLCSFLLALLLSLLFSLLLSLLPSLLLALVLSLLLSLLHVALTYSHSYSLLSLTLTLTLTLTLALIVTLTLAATTQTGKGTRKTLAKRCAETESDWVAYKSESQIEQGTGREKNKTLRGRLEVKEDQGVGKGRLSFRENILNVLDRES